MLNLISSAMKGSSMRLNIPVETDSADILNGPGATKLLDAALELSKIGGQAYAGHSGPKLEFTIESPIDGKPMQLTVEMVSDFAKIGGHYEFYGLVVGNPMTVHVTYWLRDNELGRGSIKDIVL